MPSPSDRDPDPEQVAGDLLVGIGLLVRRLKQGQGQGQADSDLTMPETSALARLDRGGPATSAELAKLEQISPQSMGATLGALEARGLVRRDPDPGDGRRAVLTPTEAGLLLLRRRRDARTRHLANALTGGFSSAELAQLQAVAPLLERLAQCL